jgi:large subunit ribosomal protein L32
MAVPKKRTSMSKKRIRRNIWRKKAYLTAIKTCSLVKSLSIEIQKVLFKKNQIKELLVFTMFLFFFDREGFKIDIDEKAIRLEN